VTADKPQAKGTDRAAGASSIALRAIEKTFGKTRVLRAIDLDIAAGEFCVFVGPSGCGKSTLLRVIAGLEDVTSGDLTIDGKRVNDAEPKERGAAMVFQSYALYPHMTVRENIAFGLELGKMAKAEIEARVRDAARILRLDALLDRLPKQLSGGQRQRVAIGRAITRNPKIFLFDEPLSNLDAALRVQMRIEIAKLHERLKATMIYVTHDQVEAMTLADRIVILNEGGVVQVGAPLELYHRPKSVFAAGFIGSPRMNFLRGELAAAGEAGATVKLATGETIEARVDARAAAAGAKVTLGIRPEHVALARSGEGERDGDGDGAAGTLRVRVGMIESLGDVAIVYLEHDTVDGVPLTVKREGEAGAERGEHVTCIFPANACHVFDADGAAFPRLDAAR